MLCIQCIREIALVVLGLTPLKKKENQTRNTTSTGPTTPSHTSPQTNLGPRDRKEEPVGVPWDGGPNPMMGRWDKALGVL
jgi:hypothetical protein